MKRFKIINVVIAIALWHAVTANAFAGDKGRNKGWGIASTQRFMKKRTGYLSQPP